MIWLVTPAPTFASFRYRAYFDEDVSVFPDFLTLTTCVTLTL